MGNFAMLKVLLFSFVLHRVVAFQPDVDQTKKLASQFIDVELGSSAIDAGTSTEVLPDCEINYDGSKQVCDDGCKGYDAAGLTEDDARGKCLFSHDSPIEPAYVVVRRCYVA